MVYISDLKNDLSGLKSDFPKLETLEYKSLETYILNYLIDSWQWKEDVKLTNDILGGNVQKFRVFLQAFLLIMTLNQKLSKFQKKLMSQSTLTWLKIAIAYLPKAYQKKLL